MNNRILLIFGLMLIAFGVFKPYIPNITTPNKPSISIDNVVVDAPSDESLLAVAKDLVDICKESTDSTRHRDFLRLSSLYADLATLIELDEEETVVKDTGTIRLANSLSGTMLRMNIKGKYPNFAQKARLLVTTAIGDDEIALTPELREKSVDAFRALSWACYEGSK